MPVKIKSATFRGIDGIMIEVEADVRKSLPAFHILIDTVKAIKSIEIWRFMKSGICKC